jgi:hypothetical protein
MFVSPPKDVKAPTFGNVRDAQYDPYAYAAQGISGVAHVQAQQMQGEMLDVNGIPQMSWQQFAEQQAGQSGLGAALNTRAQEQLALGGQLSDQDLRESSQTARTAFADRGMGRSNAAIFAEALNRDKFSRERQNERQTFAQGVEGMDLQRRTSDAGMRLQAGMANSQGQLEADQSGLQAFMQGSLANQSTGLQAALANQGAGLQAALANQQMGYNTQAFNAGAQNAAARDNSQFGLQASLANQATDLSRAQTVYQGDLTTRLSNRDATQRQRELNSSAWNVSQLANQDYERARMLADQDANLRSQLANQGAYLTALTGNQNAGLSALLGNQSTKLGKYGIDMGINQQNRMWQQNAGENRAINAQNMALIQQLMQQLG